MRRKNLIKAGMASTAAALTIALTGTSAVSSVFATDTTEATESTDTNTDSNNDTNSNTNSENTPPELPSGEAPSGDMGNGGTPPEKPDGDNPGNDGGTPPEKPDGDNSGNDGAAPHDMPGGEGGDFTGGAPGGALGGAPGGAPGGTSSGVSEYTAVTEYTEDTTTTDSTYESTGTDENAVLVSNGTTILNNATVSRVSSDSTGGDNSSFYGVGAAVLNTAGSVLVNGGTITTDSAGGAGVFAYGDGVAYVSGVTINTEQNTSGGIHVAGGGTLYAWDNAVNTNGGSAAAIRSDRGGGTMVIDGGTYTSNGSGSPAIYCTADITVNNAILNATNSEGICIEGKNALRIFDSALTSNMPDDSQNDVTWSVILYQSMSGDSEVGTSEFSMVGGSLTSLNGGLFYTTNTASTFYLNDVEITPSEDNSFFLQVTGNANQRGWGSSGSNGADCSFTADSQVMVGDIVYDSISNLDLYMMNASTLTGAVRDDETWAGDGNSSNTEACNLYISEDSTWYVSAASTVSNLYNAGSIVDLDGNSISIVGSDGTVYVEGTSSSDYVVTVTGTYSDSVDFSEASSAIAFSDYSVEKPEALTASGATEAEQEETQEVTTVLESTEEATTEATTEVTTEATTEATTEVTNVSSDESSDSTEEGTDHTFGYIAVAVVAVVAGLIALILGRNIKAVTEDEESKKKDK